MPTTQVVDTPLPPVVYVPIERTGPHSSPRFTLVTTSDGTTLLPVYTALDRLADKAGDDLPWALVQASEVQKVIAGGEADAVVGHEQGPATGPEEVVWVDPGTETGRSQA
ncbi:MAG: SseB family protein [Actinomycetaceae bacterium]